MKEFTITIDRTVKQLRTIKIKAKTKEQAYDAAVDIAVKNEDWDGKEYDTTYEIGIEEEPNNYIDKYGNPYDLEDPDACWPAGGGLHKDCEFNADALYAYYVVGGKNKIAKYLTSKGFVPYTQTDDYEEWVKGNTMIIFEDYDRSGLWGYMHTELVDDNK